MARRHRLIAAALAAAASVPASAGITVIGAGNARSCYLAAESKMLPRPSDFRRCNLAIQEGGGGADQLVASYVNRGILHLRRGNTAAALSDFDAATRLNPDEPEAYLNRASALLRQAQTSGAIAQFDAALAKQTRRPALAYYGRAIAYEEAGNVRAAYKDYLMASQLAPDWDDPRQELTRFKVVRN